MICYLLKMRKIHNKEGNPDKEKSVNINETSLNATTTTKSEQKNVEELKEFETPARVIILREVRKII